jgi:hypothetical protein
MRLQSFIRMCLRQAEKHVGVHMQYGRYSCPMYVNIEVVRQFFLKLSSLIKIGFSILKCFQ